MSAEDLKQKLWKEFENTNRNNYLSHREKTYRYYEWTENCLIIEREKNRQLSELIKNG